MLRDHRGVELHPECLEAVQRAAKLCASLGHIVVEADPNLEIGGTAAHERQDFGG
jgi:amidase